MDPIMLSQGIQAGGNFLGGIGGALIDAEQNRRNRKLQASVSELNALQSGAQMLAQRRNDSIERNRGRLFRDQVLQVLGMQV